LGCTEKCAKPRPAEYLLYYGKNNAGDLYVFETDSLSIVDSIPKIGNVISAYVSPDGEWLFAQIGSRPAQPFLKKISTRTKETVDSLGDSRLSELTPLDNGKMLLRGNPTCRREVIDANTMEVSRLVPDTICPLRGWEGGTRVAALVGGTSRLTGYDARSGELGGEYIARIAGGPTLEVVDAMLHRDGRRVLAICWSGAVKGWFVIGDLQTGETLLQHQLVYPQGRIVLNDSGTLAAVTDPSRFGTWDSDPTLDLFELDTLRHLRRFVGAEGGGLEGFPRELVFLPGTDLLIATPGTPGGSTEIHVIDSRLLQVINVFHDPFPPGTTTSMALGVRP